MSILSFTAGKEEKENEKEIERKEKNVEEEEKEKKEHGLKDRKKYVRKSKGNRNGRDKKRKKR